MTREAEKQTAFSFKLAGFAAAGRQSERCDKNITKGFAVARWRFPSYDYAGLRRSARVATARRARRASLTDFESEKASANSGSRSTTLVPRRYLSTYLPRTPPEKSYSALISTALRLEGGFFILSSLMTRCSASADQADPLTSNSMDHNQQTSLAGPAENHEALFVTTIVRVRNRNRKRVVEDAGRLDKCDAVLPLIRRLQIGRASCRERV